VYDRRTGNKELTFGVSGKLHANSLVMYDHQTDSLWSHLVGAAVTGPVKGQKLNVLESMLTEWQTWKRLHPNTKVLSSGRGGFLASLRDPYEAYYRSTDTGIIPPRVLDKRIYPKEYVLGLVMNDKAKAYPFSVLSRQPVLNDNFQGIPLLIVFDSESATGVIFKRRLEGKDLIFKKTTGSDKTGLFLADDATKSVWDGLSGKAVQGPLKGKKLDPVPMTPSFWFGWVDHYPDTELFAKDR
jgi:hypothetical protein